MESVGDRLHREAPLTDVHVHPSLKAYLLRRNLWRHYRSGGAFNPFSSRSDFHVLSKGGVGVIWAAHYLPERRLFQDCALLRIVSWLVSPTIGRSLRGDRMECLFEMMDALEREIRRKPDRVQVARSWTQLDQIRANGKIAVIHTLEGAHVLEGRLDRLDALAERGVAMITLGHFYPNGLASHVDSIPSGNLIRKFCELHLEPYWEPPLTTFGRDVLGRLKELRIIPDLTHLTPRARAAVLDEWGTDRPVVASHVGLRALRDHDYCLDDDEVRRIAATGGAVGIILMPYWLVEGPGDWERRGAEAVWRTAQAIADTTGSWDHAMIGSDFDGLTDPPDDLPDASRMGRITQKLLEKGVAEEDVKKFLGGNARRVLEGGWR